ncbi:MAG TPA: rhodanese-like domain-containing protein [Pseudonocardia sp.]|nr:rhodanese-like domain-containing protein [Pseudonocardia sp.]
MTRYVIIGAGAIGATLGAELHTAGRRVVLVARGVQLAELRERGLRYLRPDGEHRVQLPVAGGPDEVELAHDDVLLLATKSQDTEEALQTWAWRPVKGADGAPSTAAATLPVVTLQNGLDNERAALRRFAVVFGAVVWLPSSRLRPAEVVSPAAPTVGAFWLGRYPGQTGANGGTQPGDTTQCDATTQPGDTTRPDGATRPGDRLAGIAEDLSAARFLVTVVPDIQRWKAAKLVGNVTNALDALYAPSALRAAAGRAVRAEARAVLTAAGLRPAELDPAELRRVVVAQPVPEHEPVRSSTWQSLALGGPPETDFLNGEVVLAARLLGRAAPYNAALAERVQRAAAEGTLPGTLTDADLAATLPTLTRRDVLIDATELAELIEQGDAPTLLDVRWALGDPDGRRHYLTGHLPGATYVDLDSELAAPASPSAGRHPLPPLAELQAAARRWGVTAGRPVVLYDNNGGTSAARAWWLLRWAGLTDVRLLDGALAAWRALDLPLATGEEHPVAGDVALTEGHLPVLTAAEAAALADSSTSAGSSTSAAGSTSATANSRNTVLLDARAAERYRGEVEPVDPRAGHIPGARSSPTATNLTAEGTFRPTAELRDRFASLGASSAAEVGVYCGSGVTAAHEVAALAVAGIPAALYPGSWSAWSADPHRPAATGPDPLTSEDTT